MIVKCSFDIHVFGEAAKKTTPRICAKHVNKRLRKPVLTRKVKRFETGRNHFQ